MQQQQKRLVNTEYNAKENVYKINNSFSPANPPKDANVLLNFHSKINFFSRWTRLQFLSALPITPLNVHHQSILASMLFSKFRLSCRSTIYLLTKYTSLTINLAHLRQLSITFLNIHIVVFVRTKISQGTFSHQFPAMIKHVIFIRNYILILPTSGYTPWAVYNQYKK